jgi:hypothetical protein
MLGGIVVEGLSRIASLLAQSATNEMGKSTGEPLSAHFRIGKGGSFVEDPKLLSATPLDDEETFSMASRGTYKFVQSQTEDYVNRLKGHPFAPRVLVTAHQREGKTGESANGSRALGPMIYGSSGVDLTTGWFGNAFHLTPLPPNNQFPVGTRGLWFAPHYDQDTRLNWPAKLGIPSSLFPQFLSSFPYGFIPCVMDAQGNIQGGLSPVLQTLDSFQQQLSNSLKGLLF